MSKTQFYLSQCADAATKSPMAFTLGAVLIKGSEVRTRGHRKPVSLHAEIHPIFNLSGMSPSFRKHKGARAGASPQSQTPCFPRAPTTRAPHGHHLKGRRPSLHARGTRTTHHLRRAIRAAGFGVLVVF
ncbi:hypothetical protein BC826DRAFT_1187490 [Russula brevipes]|nr:hypothetical protein BC826DRAFT_1187490 [Russula brevipes]